MKTINVFSIFGTELRSRSNAVRIKELINCDEGTILDMDNIQFISRSFADELCNMKEDLNVKLRNVSQLVQEMLNIVDEGRKKNRVRKTDNSEIVEIEDIEGLKNFLLNEC